MKQNIYSAVLLAGMLALAGCGGGSSSDPANGMDDGMTGTGPKTLALPKGKIIDGGGTNGAKGTYNLAAGDKDVEIGGVYFSCPDGGEGCVVIVSDDRRSNSVTYTGATPTVSATPTPAVVNTQTNTRQGDSNDPLSNANLLAAVLKPASLGANDLAGLTTNAPATGFPITLLDKTKIKLWLRADGTFMKDDDYIYYGIWTETADQGNSPTAPKPQYRWSWGGSMPYGAKPDASLTPTSGDMRTASYIGNALLFHKLGDATESTASATNAVSLMANFAGGWIKGHVALPTSFTGNDIPDRIELDTAMYSSDMFNGKATFAHSNTDTTIKGKGNGNWKGQFFGDSSLTIDSGTQKHQAPSRVAGEFAVSRNAVTGTNAVTGLIITGVFGADTP